MNPKKYQECVEAVAAMRKAAKSEHDFMQSMAKLLYPGGYTATPFVVEKRFERNGKICTTSQWYIRVSLPGCWAEEVKLGRFDDSCKVFIDWFYECFGVDEK